MAVTIQQIAEQAGVSRGTVDRALNHRGRINPEVAERICRLADEMGYVQKERKHSRTAKDERLKIGVVTQLARSSFMQEVNRGIEKAAVELKEKGIQLILKEGLSVDEEEQLQAIEELEQEGIRGLAIMPVDSEAVREKLNALIEEKNIPVVTFNSDIVGTRRTCFVGMDKILIITGYFSNHVDNQRVDGFVEEAKRAFPHLEIAGVHGSFDEAAEVEHIIENAMMSTSGISGILVVSGGQAGVGKAFEKLRLDRRPYVVIYDQTPKNERALKNDHVDFLIDQNGYVQGYEPPRILADILTKGQEPEREYLFTDIKIKTKYNL